VLNAIRDGGDPLTKKAGDSFVAALKILQTRTLGTDLTYMQARQKYLKL
jgi:hypothetical protein